MLPHKSGKILLGNRMQGLFLMANNTELALEEFKTKFDKYLYNNTLYHGTRISIDLYALVTNHGGVVMMDSEGKLVQLYNKKAGLESNSGNFAYLDMHKNLWIAANNGVYYIESSTPISFFDEETGFGDLSVKIKRINNKLVTGTIENFYTFKRQDELGEKTKTFYEFKSIN